MANVRPSLNPVMAGAPGGLYIHNPADPADNLNFRRALDRCFRENQASFFLGVDLCKATAANDSPHDDRVNTACFDVSHWSAMDERVRVYPHV